MSQRSSSYETSSSSSSGELDTTDSESTNNPSKSCCCKKNIRSRSITPLFKNGKRGEKESENMIQSKKYKEDTNNYEQKCVKPSKCIGVFGMRRDTTTRIVEKYFEKYGHIESIRIIRDYYSRESKGFCFIKFEKLSNATDALEGMNGKEIEGKFVRVDYAIPKNETTYKCKSRYYDEDEKRYNRRRDHDYHYRKDKYDSMTRCFNRRQKFPNESSSILTRRRRHHSSSSSNSKSS
uniref:Transformer-2 sex-determining protein (inferred by orthology to a D. melanogaster protein) n=1 Tax=Strongyloides venezuelensis TaxID=75913 RepID=A0A0K0FB47_STRVS